MKIMNCPLNGPRNITEFVWGGEVQADAQSRSLGRSRLGRLGCSWRTTTAGVVREWWCHVPTSFWFIAERNTVTDEILKTYPAGELFKQRVEFAAKAKRARADHDWHQPPRAAPRPPDRPQPGDRIHLRRAGLHRPRR